MSARRRGQELLQTPNHIVSTTGQYVEHLVCRPPSCNMMKQTTKRLGLQLRTPSRHGHHKQEKKQKHTGWKPITRLSTWCAGTRLKTLPEYLAFMINSWSCDMHRRPHTNVPQAPKTTRKGPAEPREERSTAQWNCTSEQRSCWRRNQRWLRSLSRLGEDDD